MRKKINLLFCLLCCTFYSSFVLANSHLLVGTWSSTCARDDQGTYNIETFNFSKYRAIYSIKTYADSKCTKPISTLSAYRRYKLGEPISGMKNTRKLDYVFKSVTMTYNNPKAVTLANQNQYYGFTHWKLNRPKVVTNLKRNKEASPEHASGDKFFTIVKIEKDRLYMGDYASGAGTSDKTRLSKIYNVPFIKQK